MNTHASLTPRAFRILLATQFILALVAAVGEPRRSSGADLDDYDDFRQLPIRNADLVRLLGESDLIVTTKFALKKLPVSAGDASAWRAQVVKCFKGTCDKEITIAGDPKAFENDGRPYVSETGFRAYDKFLLFLKTTDKAGTYGCLEANPGGFRFHRGRHSTDSRGLWVGRVSGRLVVAGTITKYGRMTGPTTMMDALRGVSRGVRLTAKAVGGATVALWLGNAAEGDVKMPSRLELRAPLLWGEVELPETDEVLLSPEDYFLKGENPWEGARALGPGATLTARVEVPTGPRPEGGELKWARMNHRKRLVGSLGEGEHRVRFLCHVTEDVLVISNPIIVRGATGAARIADPETSSFVPSPKTGAVKTAGALRREELRGEIFFESNRAGSWDLFVMNADGANVRNLTNTPDEDEFNPVPSPDGRRVAYVTGSLERWSVWNRWKPLDKQVWVMDRDGRNPRKLAAGAVRPDWAPDGNAVLYQQQEKRGQVLRIQNLETGRVSEPLKKVSAWFRGGGELRATFSPATWRVAFNAKLWTSSGVTLMVVDLDKNYEAKSLKPLTTTYQGCTPRWSADGGRLYFAHHDPKYNGAIVLWSMKADGTDVRRFETPTRDRWPGYDLICESPDGGLITYSQGNDICVMRLSDGAELRLTRNQGSNKAPRWRRGLEGR